MTLQFKCPNCGGDMQFDAASGYLKYPHCDHSEKIEGAEMSAEIHVSPDFPHQDQVDETQARTRYTLRLLTTTPSRSMSDTLRLR